MDGPGQTALVVTSVASPTACMRQLAAGAQATGIRFYCIGDATSPPDFRLDGCEFLSLQAQAKLGYRYAGMAPQRHYARKNLGYLYAMGQGAQVILETDDDNSPLSGFWEAPPKASLRPVQGSGWYNVYEWFGVDAWPRGFPLERLHAGNAGFEVGPEKVCRPLIWQGLVAGEPDVDAIFRLTRRGPVDFLDRPPLFLGRGTWSPLNSQNTRWAISAFPLLYLPATCSFRATDIIRGYVAIRCVWEIDGGVAFLPPTVVQERNAHDLMRDFKDELEIYTKALDIVRALEATKLQTGLEASLDNVVRCYEALVGVGAVEEMELKLVRAWCEDLENLTLLRP